MRKVVLALLVMGAAALALVVGLQSRRIAELKRLAEALALCPASPEANFRLAKLFVDQCEAGKAQEVMEAYIRLDPPHGKAEAQAYLDSLRRGRPPGDKPKEARDGR